MAAINQKAVEFIERWKDVGDEKQHSQRFWIDLLESLFDVDNVSQLVKFEERVKLAHTSFIDVYIPRTKVIIEQKGRNIDLYKKAKQSDGQELSPFEQAERYNRSLPHSQKARWIVACNFKTFLIYDMEEDPNGSAPLEIKLEELASKYNELRFLVEYKDQKIIEERELSIKAGDFIGKIYDLLKPQYKDPDSENSLKSLNKLCVRLVFCFYAEDAGLFDRNNNNIFGNYLRKIETRHLRKALIELFTVLNQDPEKNERDRYLDEELARFPYVNGNLFKIESPETDEIPNFTDELRDLIIRECSDSFDWSRISPTIFGALFESTLNPETRRSGGMHYTSIENIHKVIDPLFLDELKAEFEQIKQYRQEKKIRDESDRFQQKLASLTFLDPACGSGNFLTETFLCLRHLENELIKFRYKGQSFLGLEELNPVRVSIGQFYGIEINDFAVAVANTALWIAESQMLHETESIIHREIDFLPLKTNSNICHGNALKMEWSELVSPQDLNYIIGNPPFIGARMMSQTQKNELKKIFGSKWKNAGNLDYVCAWYKKAFDLIQDTDIHCALVSTNSICQGESVAILWKPLMSSGLCINFAHRTFQWDSEATVKAHVHCIIVGFSLSENQKERKFIFDGDTVQEVKHINAYLMDFKDIFVENISKPLCDVPSIGIGNQPIDGGHYLFTKEEMDDFISREPASKEFFKIWYGAREFINNKPRYCLWLGDCTPAQLRKMPLCLELINSVRDYRLSSTRSNTQKLADTPTRFEVENMPKSSYIIIPQVSSQNRMYIPMGFMDSNVLCSDKVRLMSEGTIYHFGVLESEVHMAWMRVVCCRLKSDYSYTVNNVYNTFPWPTPTEPQKTRIEKTAQDILDARALYPDSSLADLYDDAVMPVELRKAHQANDKAVLSAFGFKSDISEKEIVDNLMQLYDEKVKELESVKKNSKKK